MIGPEPWHAAQRLIRAIRFAAASRALRTAPGFQPHAATVIDADREGAAIAGGEDIGVEAAQTLIDRNAVRFSWAAWIG
ncbi:hypothetical protein GGD50_006560 [Rhizobium paranaense]|uniref:Uncharacterized protein n=1 Tax=Rhizobium paranaense TaxID=1650438 RepID=A0A7W8XYG2_9HYPH|nr:hypothetical protein [Rhizobium paranaense]